MYLGCATPPGVPTQGLVIDRELLPYVEKFEERYKIQVTGMYIQFRTLAGARVGQCTIKSNGYKIIEIDPGAWEFKSEIDKISLMFHELGHCFLYQNHRNYLLNDNCPGSIMDEYVVSRECLDKHFDYYTDELIN